MEGHNIKVSLTYGCALSTKSNWNLDPQYLELVEWSSNQLNSCIYCIMYYVLFGWRKNSELGSISKKVETTSFVL